MPSFDTLEAAQAEIVRLMEANTALQNERDTLSQNNENLSRELGEVRTLNQQYFNKLCMQYSPQDPGDPNEPEVPSCEDFAKTLSIL